MQVDYAIELAADDETLEFPWAAPDGGPRYHDLKRHPDLLLYIDEASRVPELGEFLAAVNSTATILETAKCDVWASTEISPEEEIFGAVSKFGSYVDLVFASPMSRFSLPAHEKFARQITELLKKVPEISAAAEFLVRRCYYHRAEDRANLQEGFYLTFYLFGYGDDEAGARQRWGIAMKLVENALRQISGRPTGDHGD